MKPNCWILSPLELILGAKRANRRRGLLTGLTALVVSCILLLQIGCQEQAGVTGKPKTVVAEQKRGVCWEIGKRRL
jgi:hypothetical protein